MTRIRFVCSTHFFFLSIFKILWLMIFWENPYLKIILLNHFLLTWYPIAPLVSWQFEVGDAILSLLPPHSGSRLTLMIPILGVNSLLISCVNIFVFKVGWPCMVCLLFFSFQSLPPAGQEEYLKTVANLLKLLYSLCLEFEPKLYPFCWKYNWSVWRLWLILSGPIKF